MTAREIIHIADGNSVPVFAFLFLPLILAAVSGKFHGKGEGGRSPWKYLYAGLIYWVCFPGIFAAVVTGYTLFFSRESLLDVNLTVYLAPVLSMIGTLVVIGKKVDSDDVPGFDRISGLMTLIGLTFAIVLIIEKTRIWIWFGGSILMLALFAGGIFALLKWGAYMLFRGKDEPRIDPPSFREF